MHRITGQITGHARSMGFGTSRQADHPNMLSHMALPPNKRPGQSMSPNPAMQGHMVNLSFNVPFNSNLTGPDKDEILYSSTGAFQRWSHPDDDTSAPPYALPVHTRNVEILRSLCKQLSDSTGDRVHATVTSAKPKPVPGMQRGPLTALVTNVCISGEAEMVHKIRSKILNETPITLVSILKLHSRVRAADQANSDARLLISTAR